jgi:hypothetical protein
MVRAGEDDWEDDVPHTPHLIVFEQDGPEYSGLVDADGNPLVKHRRPIGYLADI